MRLAAALVHTFTALGAVAALMAMLAVGDRAWEHVFLWLGVALIIDGIDGTFARWVGVNKQLPRFSGERLDLVVDYVTYVFVPVMALLAAGYLDGPLGLVLAAGILLSSLFHFADQESKAEDYSFVGFPAVWNIVAFYIFALDFPHMAVVALTGICIGLTFVPMRWVHPFRTTRARTLTIVLACLWGAAALAATWSGFAAAPLWAEVVLGVLAFSAVALALISPRGAGSA